MLLGADNPAHCPLPAANRLFFHPSLPNVQCPMSITNHPVPSSPTDPFPKATLKRQKEKKKKNTYLLVDIVTAKLDRAIRHDADAIGAVAGHHAAPALLAPHLGESLANAHLILIAADILDLQQNLQALERGDDGARDGAGGAAGDEGGDDWLREPDAQAVVGNRLGGGGGGRGRGRRLLFFPG